MSVDAVEFASLAADVHGKIDETVDQLKHQEPQEGKRTVYDGPRTNSNSQDQNLISNPYHGCCMGLIYHFVCLGPESLSSTRFVDGQKTCFLSRFTG